MNNTKTRENDSKMDSGYGSTNGRSRISFSNCSTVSGDKANGVGILQNKDDERNQNNSMQMDDSDDRVNPEESRMHAVAALSHALYCMRKFQVQSLIKKQNEGDSYSPDGKLVQAFKRDPIVKGMENGSDVSMMKERGFCVALSLVDFNVLAVQNKEIKECLGYPENMMVGRNFLDFMVPRDMVTFTSEVTGVARLSGKQVSGKVQNGGNQFFIRMREYKGLNRCGFQLKNKKPTFKPFKFSVYFKDLPDTMSGSDSASDQEKGWVIAKAIPIKAAFHEPNQMMKKGVFTSRHTANCYFSYIDSVSIPFIGHLPQDIIGNSIFDYYHTEDLLKIKDDFEHVIQNNGKPYKGQACRFRTQNGGYITIRTEWSCFLNPWSKQLEFMIGQHEVIKGPSNPDLFYMPSHGDKENMRNISKDIHKKIRDILHKPVLVNTSNSLDPLATARRQRLVSAVRSKLEDYIDNQRKSVAQTKHQALIQNLKDQQRMDQEQEKLKADVMMLTEHCEQQEQTEDSGPYGNGESDPSYNQLNYEDNIERYFNSNPKTMVSSDDSSGGGGIESDRRTRNPSGLFRSPVISLDDDWKSSSFNLESISRQGKSGSGHNSSNGNNGQDKSSNSNGTCSIGTDSKCKTPENDGQTTSNQVDSEVKQLNPARLSVEMLVKHDEKEKEILLNQYKDQRKEEQVSEMNGNPRGLKRPYCTDAEIKAKYTFQSRPTMPNCYERRAPVRPLQTTEIHLQQPASTNRQQSNILWPSYPTESSLQYQSPVRRSVAEHFRASLGTQRHEYTTRASIPFHHSQYQLLNGRTEPQKNPMICVPVQYTAMAGMASYPMQGPVFLLQNMMQPNYHMVPPSALNRHRMESHDIQEPKFKTPTRPGSRATSIHANPGSAKDSTTDSKKRVGPADELDSISSHRGFWLDGLVDSKTNPISGVSDLDSSMAGLSNYTPSSLEDSLPSDSVNISSSEEPEVDEQEELLKTKRKLLPPQWLQNVPFSEDVQYRYRLECHPLEDVLQKDSQKMSTMNMQPDIVNIQLENLYEELALNYKTSKLNIGADSSTDDDDDDYTEMAQPLKGMEDADVQHVYEADANLPSGIEIQPDAV